MSNSNNYFEELAAINVNDYIEKKGQFSYLSWPFAVAQLRKYDDQATWEVMRFEGLPYLTTKSGTFVEVAVTVKGVRLSQIHPVLDGRNQPILIPTAFDINTSIQRCLVKAIALHGLGLNVYAGEDLLGLDAALASNSSGAQLRAPFKAALMKVKQDNSFKHPELLTPNQLRYIKKLLQETGTDLEQLLAYFDFDALDKIPKHEVNRVIQVLESHRQQDAA